MIRLEQILCLVFGFLYGLVFHLRLWIICSFYFHLGHLTCPCVISNFLCYISGQRCLQNENELTGASRAQEWWETIETQCATCAAALHFNQALPGLTVRTSCRFSCLAMSECLPSSGHLRETSRHTRRNDSTGRITSFNKLNQENTYYKIFFFLFTDIWYHFLLSFLFQAKKTETEPWTITFFKRVSFSLCRK